MSGRVVHFESPEHREIDALLPWHVNGTLPSGERERVEAHLAGCARCQRELEWLCEVQACSAAPPVESDADVERAWSRMRGKLGAPKGQRALAVLRSARQGWVRAPTWTRWALAAQLAFCAVLLVAWIPSRAPAPYRTLSAPETPVANEARLAVMFDPEASEDRIRALLQSCGARIVDGPTVTGAYVLAVPRAQSDRALSALRSARGVHSVASLAAPDGR